MSKIKGKTTGKIRIYEKSRRHFRNHLVNVRGYVAKHPAYIVGEGDKTYASFGITHDKEKGKGHGNHPLSQNPKAGKGGGSKIRKSMDIEHLGMYSKYRLKDFRMSKEDDEYVDGRILKALANNPNLTPPPDVRKLKPWKPPEQGTPKKEGAGGQFARKRKKK